MCILAFLARGDDPEFGPYRSHYKKALDFLLKAQNAKTGYIGSSMYNHGFSTLALAEAYGLTNDLRLGPALEKATKLIVSSQKTTPRAVGDTAPKARMRTPRFRGPNGCPLCRPQRRNQGSRGSDRERQGLRSFLSGFEGRLRIHHFQRGQLARSHRFTHSFLAKDTDSDAYKNSVEYLKESAKFGDQGHKFYSLYYTSQAVFVQSVVLEFMEFSKFQTLQSTQTENGSWNGNYGQTFATSAALLSLALNYRYLPIYER